jgi:acyl-CoA reductase-like NAD-dependent aldehyde dehydrogenase
MHTGSYINGKWFHPKSENLIRNINPADPDEIISEFPAATAIDAQHAIESAEKAFPLWKSTPAPERGRFLARAGVIVGKRMEEIARMMTREEGKTIKESRGEVMKGLAILEYYSGEGYRMGGKTLPAESRDVFTYTLRNPLGVVALITPFNFPWANPLWKLAPALVAGNTVVFKPSELTPGTASLMVEILEEAGFPPGVINMVVGFGSAVGEALVNAPQVKAISFTGSNAVGMAINAKAASLGKKVTCEMGGKNAAVVMSDAVLEEVAVAIIGAAFGSTGQRCTATSRIVVVPEVKDALLDLLVQKAKKLKIGNGLDESVDMGPVVSEAQLQKDQNYIDIAKSEGAKLVMGGKKPDSLKKGYFIEPTIFDNVTSDMRIFKEEVFGPVLSVSTANNIEEAIKIANAVEFGLSTSFFTRDVNAVMNYINKIETGMVHINEPSVGGEAQLPFGGTKATAIGDREMADEGLNFFSETKTVFINYSGKAERSLIR